MYNNLFNVSNLIVPMVRFNKGEAGKVFDELERDKTKIVVKNNNVEAVMLEPKYYDDIMQKLEDYALELEALNRLQKLDAKYYDEKEVMKELGITREDLNVDFDEEIE